MHSPPVSPARSDHQPSVVDVVSGTNAEPDESGGTFIYFSPGLLVPLGSDEVQLCGLMQLPLLQDVRGTQLTADWAAALGLSVRF